MNPYVIQSQIWPHLTQRHELGIENGISTAATGGRSRGLPIVLASRLNEALSARWADIDRVNAVWRIPAASSKSRKLHSVPLNASALAVLDSVGTAGTHEFVFINPETGRPYTTIAKVWHRLRKTAGLDGLRLHDLRHDFASRMVRAGRTLYEVQTVLGHSDPKISQRYAHLDLRTLRNAAGAASLNIEPDTREDEAA